MERKRNEDLYILDKIDESQLFMATGNPDRVATFQFTLPVELALTDC
jgi:hypothetical protein